MPESRSIYGLFVLTFALLLGLSGSVRAEFFGCKDERGKVLASWTTSSGASSSYGTSYTSRSSRYTHALSVSSSRYHPPARRSGRW